MLYKALVAGMTFSILGVAAVLAQGQSIEELRKEADAVLKLPNVEARRRVDVVFDLANRLLKSGEKQDSLKYFLAGLQNQPWNLREQLTCAKLLLEKGDKDLAEEKIRIVADHAEDDDLASSALSLMGEKAPAEIPDIKKVEGQEHTLVLIPLGDVDVLLLKEIRDLLEAELGIPVHVQRAPITMPAAKRYARQWGANSLLEALKKGVADHARPRAGYLGVTSKDIFEKDYNFLFGWGSRGYAAMSYHRFRSEFNYETPNRKRLVQRALKQCLSSAGFVFGVARCSDPTCARAYPHSLAEHDAKGSKLCSTCRKGFDSAFGRQ